MHDFPLLRKPACQRRLASAAMASARSNAEDPEIPVMF
jgi:hypothetical protein